jgi:hypothetical protein
LNARLRTGDVLIEHAEPNARWRVADYWRDVVELERLDGPRQRRFLYQEEFANSTRFRLAFRDRKPA